MNSQISRVILGLVSKKLKLFRKTYKLFEMNSNPNFKQFNFSLKPDYFQNI